MKKMVLFLVVVIAGASSLFGCAKQEKKATAKAADLQRIHFDFDRSDIKAEYQPVLGSNAAWMQAKNGKKVVIEGHCDERGSLEYNIALGDRRAHSAKNYLQNLGIESGRLTTVSYGEERPLENCHEESCWWKNRRAEFVAK